MRIQPAIGLAVGPSDDSHWGQVLVTPDAYGVVEVASVGGDAQQIGVRVLSKLGELVGAPITSVAHLEQLVRDAWEDGVASIVLLVPVGSVVHLVLRGAGGVFVKRGMELAHLMSKEGSISGEVREGDTVLLTSEGFTRLLPKEDLVRVFDRQTAADVAETLTLLLHKHQGGAGSVALVFEVSQIEKTQTVLVQEEPESAPVQPKSTPVQPRWITSVVHRLDVVKHRVIRWIQNLRRDPLALRRVGAMAVVVLFLVSVGLGVIKQASVQKNKEARAALSDAQHAFDEGVALLELNPVKGRERLQSAKSRIESLGTSVNPRTKEGRDLALLLTQINDNLIQAMQITDVPLDLFYDMSLVKQNAQATTIALGGNTVIVADQPGGTVYRLDITTKKADILAGGEFFEGISAVGIHGPNVYTLTSDGVVQTTLGDKKSTLAIKKSDQWGALAALVAFGGNVYLLDTSASRIWKYTATEKGFSDIREYLNPDTLPDLSSATGMSIDGTVWVGTRRGDILRFVQGREETFVPKGVEPALGSDLVVYATDETNNLYVLDRSSSRVVVLDKEGTYLAQYRFTSETSPTALVVSEEAKKIVLLSSGKLYSIDIK
jgi:hypothetical protein